MLRCPAKSVGCGWTPCDSHAKASGSDSLSETGRSFHAQVCEKEPSQSESVVFLRQIERGVGVRVLTDLAGRLSTDLGGSIDRFVETMKSKVSKGDQ